MTSPDLICKYAETVTDLEPDIPRVVHHKLDTPDVIVSLRDVITGQFLVISGPIQVTITGSDTITLTTWASVIKAHPAGIRVLVTG